MNNKAILEEAIKGIFEEAKDLSEHDLNEIMSDVFNGIDSLISTEVRKYCKENKIDCVPKILFKAKKEISKMLLDEYKDL